MNSFTLNEQQKNIKVVKVNGYYVQLEKVYEDQTNGIAGLLFAGVLSFIGVASLVWYLF